MRCPPELADPRHPGRADRRGAGRAGSRAGGRRGGRGNAGARRYLRRGGRDSRARARRRPRRRWRGARMQLDRARAAQQAKIEDWQRAQRAAAGRTGTGAARPRPAARRATARVRQAPPPGWPGGAGPSRRGRAQRPPGRTRKGPGPVRNITDPDSRLMPVRGGGFIQGYNAQNVTSEDGLIIATAAHQRHHRHRLVRADARATPRHAAALHRAPAARPAGRRRRRSGCCSPTPATCPSTTSPPPAPTGSSPPASTATWRKPPATPPGRRRRRSAARPSPPWPPGWPPPTASPPTATAATSPKPPTATSSTTCASASSPCAAQPTPAAEWTLHLHRPQPVQGHHQRPPHRRRPDHPGGLTPAAHRHPSPPATCPHPADDSATTRGGEAMAHRPPDGGGPGNGAGACGGARAGVRPGSRGAARRCLPGAR